jgi:hypothetical protein
LYSEKINILKKYKKYFLPALILSDRKARIALHNNKIFIQDPIVSHFLVSIFAAQKQNRHGMA